MSETARQRTGVGVAALVLATVGFSTGFPIVKGVDLPASAIAFWRLGIGVAILGLAALALRTPLPRARGPVVVAGLAFAGHQIVFIEATKLTAIAVVTFVVALQPLVVALVSRRAVGERVPPALLGWALVAIGGIGVVLYGTAGDDSRSLLGDALALVNLGLFTGYFLAAKRARAAGAPTLTLTLGFLGVAWLALLPVALLVGDLGPPSARDATWLLVLALVPGNGHLLLNWAHARVSAALASIVLAGVPLLAALWGRLFFDEPFGWPHVIGLLAVVIAIEGGRRTERRQREMGEPGADSTLTRRG
ncbi:MAG: DMT family transporter [Egibacteraceae bacterium]